MNVFKKQECKHCKLSKAVANDAAVQFNKANAELNDMKFHGALLSEENKRLNEEVKKWKHWWYIEKEARGRYEGHLRCLIKTAAAVPEPSVLNYFQNEPNT